MKGIRKLLIAALILALLLIYIEYSGKSADREAVEKQKEGLLFKDTAEITMVSWDYSGKKTVEVNKEQGNWYMTYPERFRASDDILGGISDSIFELKEKRRFSSEKISQYGLDTPELEVVFAQTGAGEHVLKIGRKTFDGSGNYSMLDNSDEIIIIPASFRRNFKEDFIKVREKVIYDLQEDSIERIELMSKEPDLSLSMIREGTEEVFSLEVQGKPAEVDTDKAASLLSQIRYMRAKEWVNETLENREYYGLEDPVYILRVYSDREYIIRVGKEGEHLYAFAEGIPGVVAVSDFIFADIAQLEKKAGDDEETEEE